MSAPDMIDRAALVDFMARVLRNLEANADASESYIRGYGAALDEVKRAAPVASAAPDLLAALKAMRDDATVAAVCKSPLWAVMVGAIAKAEGRS